MEVDEFWSRVDRGAPNECWPWRRGMSRGYGQAWHDGKMRNAAHLALIFSGRPRPGRLMALHSCDNPPCCNPAHLEWGTQAKNIADAATRGRMARGERQPKARLTSGQVVKIREERAFGAPIPWLARHYHVHPGTIAAIVYRKTWRHI